MRDLASLFAITAFIVVFLQWTPLIAAALVVQ